jgi:excisionase family DNA binding protein
MSIIKVLRERTEPLNVAELAKLLNVTEGTVLRWVRSRQIPAIRIGDVIRIDGEMLADRIELQAACTLSHVRFLHPREPGGPSEYQMTWQELGELTPKEASSPSPEHCEDAE